MSTRMEPKSAPGKMVDGRSTVAGTAGSGRTAAHLRIISLAFDARQTSDESFRPSRLTARDRDSPSSSRGDEEAASRAPYEHE